MKAKMITNNIGEIIAVEFCGRFFPYSVRKASVKGSNGTSRSQKTVW